MSKIRASQGLTEGAAVLLLATATVKLIGALFKLPLSSNAVLGDLGFGYFSSVYDLFTPVYTLALSGFPVAIARVVADYAARERFKDVKAVFKISKRIFMLFALLCFAIALLCSYPFILLSDKTGQGIYCFLAAVPSVIFCMAAAVYRGFYEGLHNMTPTAVSNVIEALGKLILGLGFAFVTVKITENAAFAAAAALLGITVGTAFSALYLRMSFAKKKGLITEDELSRSPKPFGTREIGRVLILITVPVVLSALSNGIVTAIDSITVRWQLSAFPKEAVAVLEHMYSAVISEHNAVSSESLSASALPTVLYGIRSKAYTIYNLVPTITVAVGVSAIPVITECFSTGDSEGIKRNAGTVIKLSAVISFPAGAGLIALGGRIMTLLYGDGASADIGGKMLCLYGLAAVFSGLCVSLTCVLQALGKQTGALLNVFFGVLLKIVVNLSLCAIPEVNIFGAVISTVLCYILIFVLHFYTLLKNFGKVDLVTSLIKPFIGAVCCGVTAFAVSLAGDSSLLTAAAILFAAIAYIAVLAILNTFSESDITALPMGNKLLKVCKKVKIVRK